MTKFFQILAKLQKNSSKCLNSWCLHTSMDTHGLKTCFVFLESYSPSSSSCSFPYPILVPRETALVLHDSTFWPQVVGQDVDIFLNLSQTEILAWEFYKWIQRTCTSLSFFDDGQSEFENLGASGHVLSPCAVYLALVRKRKAATETEIEIEGGREGPGNIQISSSILHLCPLIVLFFNSLLESKCYN
jgi:hypothetical protein